MAARRRLSGNKKDDRPVVVDDFIYDDPSASANTETTSDTPEDAIRKLKRKPAETIDDSNNEDIKDSVEDNPRKKKTYSSGIMLDDDLQPVVDSNKKIRKKHPVLRGIILAFVTIVLLLAVASYIFHRISPGTPGLGVP